jgi:hypothetical protein
MSQENKNDVVKVRKQIVKDNVFHGYKEILVSREIAETQLSKPKHKRHPHWRGVELINDSESGGSETKDLLAEAKAEYKKIFGRGAGNKSLETIQKEIEEFNLSQQNPDGGDSGDIQ